VSVNVFVCMFLSVRVMDADIAECASNPCDVMFGATCLDGVNRYSCICSGHRTGDKCETGLMI
jgi:hypothetical protein